MTQLWHYLLEHGLAEEGTIENQKIFKVLFSGEPFDDAKMRYVFTFLREKIEWFLAYRQFNNTPALPELLLAKTYREKGLDKHFGQSWRRAEKDTKGMLLGQEKHLANYKLEFEKYLFSEQKKRNRESTLQAVHDSFDEYIIVGKLRLACYMAAQQSVVNINYDLSFLPLIIKWLDNNVLLEKPTIGLYYHCYQALKKMMRAILSNSGKCSRCMEANLTLLK